MTTSKQRLITIGQFKDQEGQTYENPYKFDALKKWLLDHGCYVEENLTVLQVVIPEQAEVYEDHARSWDKGISFYGPDGNYEEYVLDLEYSFDGFETVARLKKNSDYGPDAHFECLQEKGGTPLSLEKAQVQAFIAYPSVIFDPSFELIDCVRTFRYVEAKEVHCWPSPALDGKLVLKEVRKHKQSNYPHCYYHWELGLTPIPEKE